MGMTSRIRRSAGVGVTTALLLCGAFASPAAHAAIVPAYTWLGLDANNGGSPNWSDGANWVGGLAPNPAGGAVNVAFATPVSCGAVCGQSVNDLTGMIVQ